ncbi:MAG: TIGR04282 family arsenosugar biosynthesis glycosyltransferase [Ginsengibacter sp.]
MKQALIIFVRNPVLGNVKSRLAATVGEERALAIYKKLLQHTHTVSQNIAADKFIFYEDFLNEKDIWENDIYTKLLQEGNDLGMRMKQAFSKLLFDGYQEIIIIGSDCYELTTTILTDAFNALTMADIVIGPASDGGYYLLGMKEFIPALFEDKSWSSETVYTDTIKQASQLNYTLTSLITLNDVDVESDIDFSRLEGLNS